MSASSFGDGDGFDAPVLEGALWALAAAGALWRTRRAPPDARAGWLLVCAGLVLIVVDKAFDVHAVAHAVGSWIAAGVDPEHHLRGPNAPYRYVALGTTLVAGVAAVVWWLRRDARIGRGKVLCLLGLGTVALLLAARLLPGLEPLLPDWVTKGVELLAFALVVTGLARGDRAPAARDRVVDGFV